MEPETLKIYIKTNLANDIIKHSKLLAKLTIFFDYKCNKYLYFDINNYSFNNMIIKKQYRLFLISKLLNCLGRANGFTKLDLTNTYYWIKIFKSNE